MNFIISSADKMAFRYDQLALATAGARGGVHVTLNNGERAWLQHLTWDQFMESVRAIEAMNPRMVPPGGER